MRNAKAPALELLLARAKWKLESIGTDELCEGRWLASIVVAWMRSSNSLWRDHEWREKEVGKSWVVGYKGSVPSECSPCSREGEYEQVILEDRSLLFGDRMGGKFQGLRLKVGTYGLAVCSASQAETRGRNTKSRESIAGDGTFFCFSLISLSKSVDPNKLPVNPVVFGQRS